MSASDLPSDDGPTIPTGDALVLGQLLLSGRCPAWGSLPPGRDAAVFTVCPLPSPMSADAEQSALSCTSLGGEPCRRCLTDAEPGERLLLLSYDPFLGDSPYRCASPVFVHAEKCKPFDGPGLPEQQRRRLLSARAYDDLHLMFDADIVAGAALPELLERFFNSAAVSYVHLHYARQGCFAARVDRA